MIVEDQIDRGVGRIGGIEELEEFDEFAAAMTVPDQGMNLAADKVDAGQQADRAVAFRPRPRPNVPNAPDGDPKCPSLVSALSQLLRLRFACFVLAQRHPGASARRGLTS
jgi:hypothetical protein